MRHKRTGRFLNVDELCEALEIGRNTAYNLLNSHEIHALKIGGTWKIPKESLEDYIYGRSHSQVTTRPEVAVGQDMQNPIQHPYSGS